MCTCPPAMRLKDRGNFKSMCCSTRKDASRVLLGFVWFCYRLSWSCIKERETERETDGKEGRGKMQKRPWPCGKEACRALSPPVDRGSERKCFGQFGPQDQ